MMCHNDAEGGGRMELECAIVGGGPAGLGAALVLGRARRRVAVFDAGKPRNAVARHTHGFLTRDGASPGELRQWAWQDIAGYNTVRHIRLEVVAVRRFGRGFELLTERGAVYYARKLLLATGLSEALPAVPGIGAYYGSSLFSCPYCDGWELRDRPLIVIAEGANAFSLARLVYQWSRDLLLCTNGADGGLSPSELQALRRHGIGVVRQRIAELQGEGGQLHAVRFEGGAVSRRSGGFVSPYWMPSPLGEMLGCATNEQGGLWTDGLGRTSVCGVYAAGDASIIAPAQALIAAGEGSKAAIGVHTDLAGEDFGPS